MTPENCKLIDPPELDPKIKAAVSDIIAKHNKAIQLKQKESTAGNTCLVKSILLYCLQMRKIQPC